MYNDKIYGLIFGQALGDAIGLTTEFMNKQEILESYKNINANNYNFNMIKNDYHRSNWKKGDWTDDTDQFLLILELICENKLDQFNFSKKLLNWLKNGIKECGDIKSYGVGNTLSIWWGDTFVISNPILAGLRGWIYNPYYPMSNSSNGSLMRTSILGIIKDKEIMFNKTMEISMVTHPDPKCILSCLFLVNIVHTIIYKEETSFNSIYFANILNEVKPYFYKYCNDFNNNIINFNHSNDDFKQVITENLKNFKFIISNEIINEFEKYINTSNLNELDLVNNIGYCLKPIGCLCVILRNINKKAYLEHIIDIMLEGGDADTNCAIVGGVIGCYFGKDNLPNKLISQMPYLDYLNNQVSYLRNNKHL
jgi:ADP-ribosylglycohydrolase